MRVDSYSPIFVAVAPMIVLGILFGSTGLLAGGLALASALCVYLILHRFKFASDVSATISIPLGIITLSSLTYGIGLLVTLKLAIFISLGIMGAFTVAVLMFRKLK